MKRIGELGEEALLERLLGALGAPPPPAGPGDDCAVVDGGRGPLRLLKTDAIVAGVHFEAGEAPSRVGWKAVARVLSDFAAMGGRPRRLMVTVALPASTEVRWVEGLYRGMRRCLERHGGELVGGETSGVPEGSAAVISVAGEGEVARGRMVPRGGGGAGEVLVVSGVLGGSLGGWHLRFEPRLAEGERLAAAGATAMMDLSDGLARDLPRLARASGCGFEIERERLPRRRGCSIERALGDGEDYELLAALPRRRWERLRATWPAELAPLREIGRLTESGGELSGGWEHFSNPG